MKEKKNLPAVPLEQQLNMYRWTTDEYLLTDWYSHLIVSGDMLSTFLPSMRHLSTFLNYFKGSVLLAYAVDTKGIWFAFVVEPMMDGATVGVWFRADKRQSLTGYRLLSKCYDESFKIWPVLIGYCKQEHLRDIHLKMGYTHLGMIPKLWSGNSVDVYILTNERWKSVRQSKSAKHE